jgi:serine/threonine protein phosphatase PrpC
MKLPPRLAGWFRAGSGTRPAAEARTPRPPISVSRSHVGRVRMINEDRVFDSAAAGLWAIADGMGGHAAGDVAAQAVVSALHQLSESAEPFDGGAIETALVEAGRRVHGTMSRSGSTVVALHIDGLRGTVLWAGDSRAYRLRDGRMERLTRDHSVVQDLIDAGAIRADQADRHPEAHVITRALGTAPDVAVDRRDIDVREGDLFLLCSDGLSRGCLDGTLSAALGGSIPDMADRLLARALEAGGNDNISLLLVAVGGPWQTDETYDD